MRKRWGEKIKHNKTNKKSTSIQSRFWMLERASWLGFLLIFLKLYYWLPPRLDLEDKVMIQQVEKIRKVFFIKMTCQIYSITLHGKKFIALLLPNRCTGTKWDDNGEYLQSGIRYRSAPYFHVLNFFPDVRFIFWSMLIGLSIS